MAKYPEIIEAEGKKFKILEQVVDQQTNCIKRTLVPINYDEDDVPEGARLLDARETEGHLARASKPDIINVGDSVTLKVNPGEEVTDRHGILGTVEAKLKEGRFRVAWADGKKTRHDLKELARNW